jgi:hypothetical protein
VLKRSTITLAPLAAVAALMLAPGVAQAELEVGQPVYTYKNGSKIGATKVPEVAWGRLILNGATGPITCINTFYAYVWNPEGGGTSLAETDAWATNACEAPELEQILHEAGILPPEVPLEVQATPEMPLSAIETPEGPKALHGPTSLPWKNASIAEENTEFEEVVSVLRAGMHEFSEAETANGNTETGACYPASKEWQAAGTEGCVKVNIILPQLGEEIVYHGTSEGEGANGTGNGLAPSHLVFHGESEEVHAGILVSQKEEHGTGTTEGSVKILGAEGQELMTSQHP